MDKLKKMKIWLCWIRKKTKDGKWTKVPIAASGKATGTDEAHRDTWVTYEEAVRAAKLRHYSGVGFVIPVGYFMLDVDHKELDDPLVQKMLKRFRNTYVEKSVSGHGVHFLGKIEVDQIETYTDQDGKRRLSRDYYQKNSKLDMELYIGGLTNRYCTYSVDAINDVPLDDCTEAVQTTLEQEMRRESGRKSGTEQRADKPRREQAWQEEDAAPERTAEELDAEAEEITAAMCLQKNGQKFGKLYYKGDCSDYQSASEADAALCSMIAYRTGDDPELIEYIFSKSALNRDKWESRKDYRRSTIDFVLRQYRGRFHPSKTDHPYFIVFSKKGVPSLEPSLLARYTRETLNYILVRDSAMRATLIYVYENGVYRLHTPKMFEGVIKQPVMEYDDQLVKMPKITEACNQLLTDKATHTQEDLDADESIICFQNKLLKVTPKELISMDHTPDVICTTQIPCDWTGKETPTPYFDSFMETLTNGDKALEKLLLQFFGVAASNVFGYRMKKALFLYGPGDTGKSLFKSLMEKILGSDNHMGADLQDIEARFGTGSAYGKRLVGSSDMSFMTINELKAFKKMTGGDSLHAEFKGDQIFSYVFKGLMCFCMNGLPKFGGDDGKHVYDRIIPVHCTNVISPEDQDKNLLEKMYAEREGIMYKVIKELQGVIANGYRFDEPQSVIDARADYLKENNTVIGFFTECMCRKNDDKYAGRHSISAIYNIYRNYCELNNNGHTKTMAEFRKRIAVYLGITVKDMMWHNQNGSIFKYYDLTDEALKEYSDFAA